jgi:hypothetical protein
MFDYTLPSTVSNLFQSRSNSRINCGASEASYHPYLPPSERDVGASENKIFVKDLAGVLQNICVVRSVKLKYPKYMHYKGVYRGNKTE